jgi:hypothetical protein
MPWILTSVAVLAGIIALMAAMLVKRAPDLNKLGRVSNRWILEHRVD